MTSQDERWAGLRPAFHRDSYTWVALLIFALIFLEGWKGYVRTHEFIYLLGSLRVVDPAMLADDITWGGALPPTSFLFDHMVAPLWSFFDAFSIVNIGRFVTWVLTGWSLSMLARSLRLPPWSVVFGYGAFLFFGQTLGACGLPHEGFQVKSFAYPLIYFALVFAMRGQVIPAGLALGLATAFHIIVGGWACTAVFASMILHRRMFSIRQLAAFLLATAPFILPVLIATVVHTLGAASGDQGPLMDEIYVTFAMPHCCQPEYFMNPVRWWRASWVFLLLPVLLFLWPVKKEARFLLGFVMTLFLIFAVGLAAEQIELYAFMKLYPYQMAKAIPLFLFFMFAFSNIGAGLPKSLAAGAGWVLLLVVTIWMLDSKDALQEAAEAPAELLDEWRDYWTEGPQDYGGPRLYAWIRGYTPKDALFLTPFTHEFWFYAQRSQFVSVRHPPLDRRLIEWKERLEVINDFEPYEKRSFSIERRYNRMQATLPAHRLVYLRETYGVTHYLTHERRADLHRYLLFMSLEERKSYYVYGLAELLP